MTNTSRLWKVLAALLVVSFGILLYYGHEIYVAAPPIPESVKTTTGETLFTRGQYDIGRFWQIFLFIGLMLWLLLVSRTLWPALKARDDSRSITMLLFLSTIAIGLFYGAGLFGFLINPPLALMALLSLLPMGLLQVHSAVSHGFWYARSADFLQQPLMQTIVWMRMPGDVIFAAGALMLALFVARLFIGRAREAMIAVPAQARR